MALRAALVVDGEGNVAFGVVDLDEALDDDSPGTVTGGGEVRP
jgi:hypothetical protein